MTLSTFVEATGKLECAVTALQILRDEYRKKRITPEQRARAGSQLAALAREILETARVFDGR